MRVAIARTMAEFSLDIYTDNLIAGLKKVRPEWEIIELVPRSFDRGSYSISLRIQKYYERFWRYPQAVRQQVADIFHIVEPCDANIAYWLQNSGSPIVVTCHDLANYFFPDNLQGSVQLPIVSKRAWLYSVNGMRYADHLISVSSATASDTTEILEIDPTQITVIPNAVEDIFGPLPKSAIAAYRQQQHISPATFCLLNVGSNHPRKNIDTILEAIAILKDRQLPIAFWKAGADFTSAQQQFIQDRGLESIVRYFGKPDKSTLLQLYNAADVLVAPSLYEGFGMTLLEAMACGTPAITSNASAMPEVVGDAGVLVAPTSADEIAAAAIRLYHEPQFYQELVDRGLERVKAFTWERNAECVAQVYERTIANKK
ncbi:MULTISPECIES: glycosyltransferase family 1 protein [unclassified Chamaesiphon]|uniref:glycosyltransferase family 4 protein n=1 Tax=unclassified Chamaesiphon TaxID=2620921 RepID=UPI00286AFB4C|nr:MULTISPECIES: glycosyltransferase family 1 protein [unclassified Chamaesiphon]